MDEDNVTLATELTVAWLSNGHNRITPDEVPAFLRTMHETLNALSSGSSPVEAEAEPAAHEPAVSVRKSLASRDHIISLIDGKPYRTLRRHLSGHGLTPEDYRERYGLKADYPMVAPSYSEARRDMAHRIGLGRKAKAEETAAASEPEVAPEPAKPKRTRKASGMDALKTVRAKAAKPTASETSEGIGEE